MIHVYCVTGSSLLQAVLIVKLVILMMVNMKIVVFLGCGLVACNLVEKYLPYFEVIALMCC